MELVQKQASTKPHSIIEDVHSAACMIDGLVTCAEAMQDEIEGALRMRGVEKDSIAFQEALTVVLASIRYQVIALKKLADA